jgi:hypothetical protein
MRAAFSILLCACGVNLTPPGTAPQQTTCVPNLDGQIDRAELEPALGTPASYLVSGARAVDLAGATDAAGHLVWDFTRPATGDPRVPFAATPLDGKWYAASFPGGQFVVPVDAQDTLEAVYSEDDAALWLHGIASTAPDQTLLPYDAPVGVDRFPLQLGAAWTETGTISAGTLDGLPYVGKDTYAITVDAAGRAVLPELEVEQALKITTRVTVAPALGAPVVRRQASFLFECLGEVARATSRDGETSDDFTMATEVRRLTF